MNLRLKQILEITNGELIIGNLNEICGNFSYDTRTIQKDDIYIGFKGEKIDGSIYWKDAFEKGAKAVIIANIQLDEKNIKKYKEEGKSIIKVKDTVEAFGKIAKYKRGLYNIPIVGVTGSVGKTSTKDIIASVVSQKYNTLKTEGNNNNHIGLPLTLLRLRNEEAAIVEMGMNHLGEISYLSEIAKPTIAVITNIGTSHIGNLGSRENILKAKLEILEGMQEKKIIINNDNDLLHKWYEENKEKLSIITYGINNKSDIMANNIEQGDEGSVFTCKTKQGEIKIEVPVGGEHFIYNAMCAVAVGKELNLTDDEIFKGIRNFELTKKRMEVIEIQNDITLINDTYNASLESISASLQYMNGLNNKRKIAVLGDVLELGEFSKELHKKIGEEVVKNKIDLLICTGEDSKYVVENAITNGMPIENVYYEDNIKNVTIRIEKEMKQGDVILLKASNGMKFYNIATDLINKYKNKELITYKKQ